MVSMVSLTGHILGSIMTSHQKDRNKTDQKQVICKSAVPYILVIILKQVTTLELANQPELSPLRTLLYR